MTRIGSIRSLAVALVAGAAVACSPGAAPVAPTRTGAPSHAVAPSPVTSASSAAPTTASASPADPPVVLNVACDGVRTTIAAPVVRPQADGVHIRFENTSGSAQPFTIEDVGGSEVPIEGGSFTYQFGPGSYELTCAGDLVAFDVVDPVGLYKPVACADAGSGTTGTNDYVEGATGKLGTVVEVARRQLRGLAPGDVVEQAGYPMASGAGTPSVVVVIRHGVILAVLTYSPDRHGGWLLETTRTCAGADITIVG